MPLYSREQIEEVRTANNIVDVISSYVKLKRRGKDYVGLCPFHNEKTGSFYVSNDKQMYHCFGCGASGTVLTFVMEYENMTFPETIEHLASRAGITLPTRELSKADRAEADYHSRMLAANKEAGTYYYMLLRGERGAHALEYFKKRQLSDETMRKFGLGYSDKYYDDLYRYLKSRGYDDKLLQDAGLVKIDEKGARDRFWNRAMFPIMNVQNRIIGFGGRVLGDGEPKYLNSPETKIFDKSHTLYGLNLARQSRRPQLLLCEGYMDVIALHQAGFDNAVASLGTSFTEGHAALLKRYTSSVCLTFDSDGAGIKAAIRAIPILREAGLSAKVINMKPYKDPDEFIKALGAQAYQERIDQAENSFLFEIRILEQTYTMTDPESKTAFFYEVAKRLLIFTEELERSNYMEAIAANYHISMEKLQQLVVHVSMQGDARARQTPPKSGIHKKGPPREDGRKKSQKLLLTWLSEEPEIYPMIKPFITPGDFTDDLCRRTAVELFAQLESGQLDPARIPSHFEDLAEQKEIASAFHETIAEVHTRQERERALKDTLIRLKEDSIRHKPEGGEPQDMQQSFQKVLSDKKLLEQLRRMEFHLPG